MHFCCSHYISPCFLSTSPFHSLFLSLAFSFFLSLSLSLSLSLYLCPLFLSVVARHMSSDALYQIFSSWSILLFHTISFHSSYKNHQLFTDYLLRLPSSELLEKHLFRSRANRRLVSWFIYLWRWRVHPSGSLEDAARYMAVHLSAQRAAVLGLSPESWRRLHQVPTVGVPGSAGYAQGWIVRSGADGGDSYSLEHDGSNTLNYMRMNLGMGWVSVCGDVIVISNSQLVRVV